MKNVLLLALSFVITMGCQEHKTAQNPADRIVIEASLKGNWINRPVGNTGLEDGLELKYAPTHSIAFKPSYRSVRGKIVEGDARWVLYSAEPVRAFLITGVLKLLSPGDSIHISLEGNKPVYTGKGSEKINLWERLKEEGEKLPSPTQANFIITSVEDYLYWDQYACSKIGIQLSLIDSSRHKIAQPEYDYIKAEAISTAELDRLNAFEDLLSEFAKQKLHGVSTTNLCAIWDSTQYRAEAKWLRTLAEFYGSIYVINLFNEMEVQRMFGFNGKSDSLHSRENRNYFYYTTAKKNYTGQLRERLITYLLVQDVIPKMNPGNSTREWIIKDYYSQPGFPEYKQMVKNLQKKKE